MFEDYICRLTYLATTVWNYDLKIILNFDNIWGGGGCTPLVRFQSKFCWTNSNIIFENSSELGGCRMVVEGKQKFKIWGFSRIAQRLFDISLSNLLWRRDLIHFLLQILKYQ